MKNNLDASQNLAEIINVIINNSDVVDKMDVIIDNSKTITNVITELAKSVDTINKKIDIKTFKQSSKNLSIVIAGVNEYIGGMIDVINNLKDPKYGITFDKEFQISMLGVDYNLQRIADATKDENTKESLNKDIEMTKKSSVPQQIITFSNVIGELFKSFSKLGELAANPKSIISFRIGMEVLKGNITSLMDMMVSTFKSLAVDDNLKGVLDVLVTEPETVIRNTKNITKYSNGKDVPSDTIFKSGDITKKGKQGLLDVITNTLNIISMINGIPVPNMLTFRIKLKLSMKQITMLWDDLHNFIGDGSQFNPVAIDNLNKTFEGLMQTYGSIEEITKSAVNVLSVFKKQHTKRLPEIMSVLFSVNPKDNSVLFIVGQAVSSTEFNNITKESTLEKFDNFKKIITTLKQIAISISIMGVLLVPLLLAILSIKVFKKTIDLILNTFNSDMLKNIEKSQKAINQFAILIGILSASILLLAITGILVKESISSIFYVALYCILVIGIFYLMTHLIKGLKELKLEKEILYLSAAILSIAMTVLILALTGQLIQEEWENFGIISLFFGVVVLGFVAVALTVKLLKELELTKSILYLAGAVLILSLTAMLLALTSRFIIAEWENFGIVSLFLVVLIGAAMLLALATNWIKEAGKSLLYISLSVGILVLIMYLLVPISYLVNENWDNLLMTMALLGALVVAVIGVAYAAKLIEKGTKPLILIAITMIILSSSILILNEAGKNLSWEAFGMFAAIVVLLSGLAIGLGYPAVKVLAKAGAITLIMLGAAFMMFAVSLKTIVDTIKTMKDLNIDAKNDAKKIQAPIEVLFGILSYANGLDKKVIITGKRRLRVLSKSMSYISNIAEVLQNIASLNIPTKFDNSGRPIGFRSMNKNDFIAAAQNAIGMVRIVACLFADEEKPVNILGTTITITPISDSDLKLITNKTKRKIKKLSEITSFIGDIAETLQNVASLRVPKAFDEQGKPTGYTHMEEDDFKKASSNVVKIISTLINTISSENITKTIKSLSKRSLKNISVLLSSIGNIKNVVDAIQSLAEMRFPVKFDSNGTATEWRSLTEDETETAKNNLTNLLKDILLAVSSEELTSTLNDMGVIARKNFETIMGSISGINELVDAVIKIGSSDKITDSTKANLTGMLKDMLLAVGSEELTKTLNDLSKKARNNFESIMGSISGINNLVDAVVKIGSADKNTTINDGIANLKTVINDYAGIFTKDNNNSNLNKIDDDLVDKFDDLFSIQEKINKIDSKKVSDTNNSFIKFIDKANSIDTNKIQTVKDMFAEMTELSKSLKGNFDKLADVLSDKLVVVLEKLQETISGIPTNVSVSQNTTNKNNSTNKLGSSVNPQNNDKINKNLIDIKDSLDDMILLLTSVKNNTDNL